MAGTGGTSGLRPRMSDALYQETGGTGATGGGPRVPVVYVADGPKVFVLELQSGIVGDEQSSG